MTEGLPRGVDEHLADILAMAEHPHAGKNGEPFTLSERRVIPGIGRAVTLYSLEPPLDVVAETGVVSMQIRRGVVTDATLNLRGEKDSNQEVNARGENGAQLVFDIHEWMQSRGVRSDASPNRLPRSEPPRARQDMTVKTRPASIRW